MGIAHLPKFGLHRDAVAADTPGTMPVVTPFNCRGYETVLVTLEMDGSGGTADLEVWVLDDEDTPNGYLIDSTTATPDGGAVELKAFGGQIRVGASAYGGTATKATIKIAGAAPERALVG